MDSVITTKFDAKVGHLFMPYVSTRPAPVLITEVFVIQLGNVLSVILPTRYSLMQLNRNEPNRKCLFWTRRWILGF